MDWPAPGEADWDAIYAEHLPRIYNYFRFRLAAEADVEDLTARVFEKAWSARSRYQRDVAAFSTWLYRIAQNVGTEIWRGPEQPGDRAARGVELIERRDDPAPHGANVAVAMVAAESTDER